MSREATRRLLDLIDDGVMDRDLVILACLNYMSEDDVADMCRLNGYFEHDEEDDEEDDEKDDEPTKPIVPPDFEVQPIDLNDPTAIDPATCGTCGLSWDDGKPTSWTPAPSGRCPFEYFHQSEEPPRIQHEPPYIERNIRET